MKEIVPSSQTSFHQPEKHYFLWSGNVFVQSPWSKKYFLVGFKFTSTGKKVSICFWKTQTTRCLKAREENWMKWIYFLSMQFQRIHNRFKRKANNLCKHIGEGLMFMFCEFFLENRTPNKQHSPFSNPRKHFLKELERVLAQRAVMHFLFYPIDCLSVSFPRKSIMLFILLLNWARWEDFEKKIDLETRKQKLNGSAWDCLQLQLMATGKKKNLTRPRQKSFSSCFGNIHDMKRFRYYQILLSSIHYHHNKGLSFVLLNPSWNK